MPLRCRHYRTLSYAIVTCVIQETDADFRICRQRGTPFMSKAEDARKAFKALLATGKTLIVPGVHDPVSAMLAARAGFPALYVGSYATAAAGFGLPDVGLVGMEEMAAYAKRIADAVDVPVLADAENGWSNAANLWRTVRSFEQAGVCGIHIEDHEFGKHAPVPQLLADRKSVV